MFSTTTDLDNIPLNRFTNFLFSKFIITEHYGFKFIIQYYAMEITATDLNSRALRVLGHQTLVEFVITLCPYYPVLGQN